MSRQLSLKAAEACFILSELEGELFSFSDIPAVMTYKSLVNGGYVEIKDRAKQIKKNGVKNVKINLTEKGHRAAIEFEKSMERYNARLRT